MSIQKNGETYILEAFNASTNGQGYGYTYLNYRFLHILVRRAWQPQRREVRQGGDLT